MNQRDGYYVGYSSQVSDIGTAPFVVGGQHRVPVRRRTVRPLGGDIACTYTTLHTRVQLHNASEDRPLAKAHARLLIGQVTVKMVDIDLSGLT